MAPDYNIPATAALDDRGVAGRDALAKIDACLAGRRPTDQLYMATIALDTDLLESEVAAALDEYVREGVLSKEQVLKCSVCGATEIAELVYEARGDGDEYPCPGSCEGDLAADGDAIELSAYIPEHELPATA